MGHNRSLINLTSRPHCTLGQIFTPYCISHLKSYIVTLSETGQQRRLLSKVQIKRHRMIKNGVMTTTGREKFKSQMNSSFYRKLNSKDFKKSSYSSPWFSEPLSPCQKILLQVPWGVGSFSSHCTLSLLPEGVAPSEGSNPPKSLESYKCRSKCDFCSESSLQRR